MRFFIKAYPMHENEVHALELEAESNAFVGDIQEGLVVGIADEAAVARLAAKGVVVQTLGPVSEDREAEEVEAELIGVEAFPAEPGGDVFESFDSLGSSDFADADDADPDQPRYWPDLQERHQPPWLSGNQS